MEGEWGGGARVAAEVHEEFTENRRGETYSREINVFYSGGQIVEPQTMVCNCV